jgi:hypothetical protein
MINLNNEIRELAIDELDAVSGGALSSDCQMSMISLQSVMSRSSTMLTLVSNVMGAMNAGMNAVAANAGK